MPLWAFPCDQRYRETSFGNLSMWILLFGTTDEDMWLESLAACISSSATINSRVKVSMPVKTRAPLLHGALYKHVSVFMFRALFWQLCLLPWHVAQQYVDTHNVASCCPFEHLKNTTNQKCVRARKHTHAGTQRYKSAVPDLSWL